MKILVTGDRGLVGMAFCNLAVQKGYQVFRASRWGRSLDTWFLHMLDEHNPTHVLHLAAKVGGVGANLAGQADFAFKNISLTATVFDGLRWYVQKAAHTPGLRPPKLCSVLSTCIYPTQGVTYPLTEDQIHSGPPDPSNYGYAYAKRELEVLTRAHRDQYGLDWISVVPCNVFGEHDNWSLEGGHVVPALVHKFYLAKTQGKTSAVEVWGDGTALRQFVYSKNLAHQLLQALEYYDSPVPLNLGTQEEVSILDTVNLIARAFKYPVDQVVWDTTKPNGLHRKPASLARLEAQPWYKRHNETPFPVAIRNTVRWFETHYPIVRGACIVPA